MKKKTKIDKTKIDILLKRTVKIQDAFKDLVNDCDGLHESVSFETKESRKKKLRLMFIMQPFLHEMLLDLQQLSAIIKDIENDAIEYYKIDEE